MDGEIAMFAGVSAQDIRAAQALAVGQKRSFGFGWIENHLRAKAAAAVAAAQGKQATAVKARRTAEQADEEGRQRTIDAQRLERWERLDAAHRERYLAEARRRNAPLVKKADVLLRLAMAIAWPGPAAGRAEELA
jgi:hypothetical protein